MSSNKEKLSNLPGFDGTGSGLNFTPDKTQGVGSTPPYKTNHLLEFLRRYWAIITGVGAILIFFLYQIWTPIVVLKSDVATLQKDVQKHDSIIEKIRENINDFYRESYKQKPEVKQKSVSEE